MIALLALEETVCPQWKHGGVSRQVAHLGDDAVGVSAIHEIIVRTVFQALESEFLRSIHEF